MSTCGSSIAASHLSIFAFLANDIPARQLEGDALSDDFVIEKGTRIMLTQFPRSSGFEKDHIRFYSNEHRLHGTCQPDDVQNFDKEWSK